MPNERKGLPSYESEEGLPIVSVPCLRRTTAAANLQRKGGRRTREQFEKTKQRTRRRDQAREKKDTGSKVASELTEGALRALHSISISSSHLPLDVSSVPTVSCALPSRLGPPPLRTAKHALRLAFSLSQQLKRQSSEREAREHQAHLSRSISSTSAAGRKSSKEAVAAAARRRRVTREGEGGREGGRKGGRE